MRVLSSDQEKLLSMLIELAGDPVTLQDALKELADEAPEDQTLKDLVRKIVELRNTTTHA